MLKANGFARILEMPWWGSWAPADKVLSVSVAADEDMRRICVYVESSSFEKR